MRAGVRLSWRLATAVAFGGTAVLAVVLSGRVPSAALRPASSTGVPQAAAVPACAPAGLRISVGPGYRVAAAVTRYALDFTNVSPAPCLLSGYPRVAAYRGKDIQVGEMAALDRSTAASRILLSPGQTAHASLDAATASARCRPVRAAGLSVVVSSGSGARYIRRPLTACAGGQDYLRVRAIQSGAGIA
jgi:hypothetical protein